MSVPDPAIYTDAYVQELDRRSQLTQGVALTNRPTRLVDAYPLA